MHDIGTNERITSGRGIDSLYLMPSDLALAVPLRAEVSTFGTKRDDQVPDALFQEEGSGMLRRSGYLLLGNAREDRSLALVDDKVVQVGIYLIRERLSRRRIEDHLLASSFGSLHACNHLWQSAYNFPQTRRASVPNPSVSPVAAPQSASLLPSPA